MLAVITGSTSGIGKSMAEYLCSLDWNLILTGRNESVLNDFKLKYGDRIDTIKLDLSKREDCFALYNYCKTRDIDLFVNNAGFGNFGEFQDIPLYKDLSLINVNITALTILTKMFLKIFKNKNRGTILEVSSSAGFMPGPLMSTYYASKNYVTALTVAVSEELKQTHSNVKICALCPGPVDTKFNKTAGVKFAVKPLSSDKVAKYAIDNALKGKTIIIPGLQMKFACYASRLLTPQLLAKFTYYVQMAKDDNAPKTFKSEFTHECLKLIEDMQEYVKKLTRSCEN